MIIQNFKLEKDGEIHTKRNYNFLKLIQSMIQNVN